MRGSGTENKWKGEEGWMRRLQKGWEKQRNDDPQTEGKMRGVHTGHCPTMNVLQQPQQRCVCGGEGGCHVVNCSSSKNCKFILGGNVPEVASDAAGEHHDVIIQLVGSVAHHAVQHKVKVVRIARVRDEEEASLPSQTTVGHGLTEDLNLLASAWSRLVVSDHSCHMRGLRARVQFLGVLLGAPNAFLLHVHWQVLDVVKPAGPNTNPAPMNDEIPMLRSSPDPTGSKKVPQTCGSNAG